MMRKNMLSLCAVAAVFALSAGIVEETRSRPELVCTMEVAPFGDVAQKVTSFGTMINNPIVPTLLLTTGQQQLVEKFGRFRADAPLVWLAYVQTPALEVAATNTDQIAASDLFELVLVYPSVDGPANMLLRHPGATKEADGTLHLLPAEGRPDDLFVKYSGDNRYCAFAASSALAARALADFSALAARRNPAETAPLLRVEVPTRGFAALATLQNGLEVLSEQASGGTNDTAFARTLGNPQTTRKLQAYLSSIASCVLTLDLDKSGLSLDARLAPKPGLKTPLATPFALPAAAFDSVPASAPLFFFAGDRLCLQAQDEAAFRADMDEAARQLATAFAALRKDDENKKIAPFLNDVEALLANILKEVPFPAVTDWTGAWLAFDGALHPYLEQVEHAAQASAEARVTDTFWKGLAAAVEKQWPGRRLLVHEGTAVAFDWHALIDICGAEAGVKPGDEAAKELANAKRKIDVILGSGRTLGTGTHAVDMNQSRYAAPGLKPAVDTSRTGEARVAAALPEVAAHRPAAVFYLAPYAFVRDAILPIMVKTSAKKDAKQYETMIAAMPPAEKNGALAYACWVDPDGSVRSLLRVTADELKNCGAAFNAFTAASMASATDDD